MAYKKVHLSEWMVYTSNRAGGIRTHGLHVPNVALYQAEPQPVMTGGRRLYLDRIGVNRSFA
jgi:hypothetical protein